MNFHFVGQPDKLDIRPSAVAISDSLYSIQYQYSRFLSTPKTSALKVLFKWFFQLVFKAAKAEVACSNRAG